ncbi:MAG: transcriptional regulator [Segetibacter sp.]|nr:transcriptional regulator [Segetibacter sp.]
MKILIAEDEPVILETMKLRLKRDGHEILTATNGKEAIEEIIAANPDIIITDIMMPFNSGIEVLGFAKSKNKNTKVIVLSMMGQENVVLEAFQLGADDYITKPFSPNELVARVNRLR